jgi:hypothetical protein
MYSPIVRRPFFTVYRSSSPDCNQLSIRASTRTHEKDVECYSQSLEALAVEDRAHISHYDAYQSMAQFIEKEDPAAFSSESGSSFFPGETGLNLSFLYGSVSDEIGEACVCWGADILVLEQKAGDLSKKPVYAPVATPPRAIGRDSTVSGWRLLCTPSTSAYMASWGFDSRVCLCLDLVLFSLRQEREGAISVWSRLSWSCTERGSSGGGRDRMSENDHGRHLKR